MEWSDRKEISKWYFPKLSAKQTYIWEPVKLQPSQYGLKIVWNGDPEEMEPKLALYARAVRGYFLMCAVSMDNQSFWDAAMCLTKTPVQKISGADVTLELEGMGIRFPQKPQWSVLSLFDRGIFSDNEHDCTVALYQGFGALKCDEDWRQWLRYSWRESDANQFETRAAYLMTDENLRSEIFTSAPAPLTNQMRQALFHKYAQWFFMHIAP